MDNTHLIESKRLLTSSLCEKFSTPSSGNILCCMYLHLVQKKYKGRLKS